MPSPVKLDVTNPNAKPDESATSLSVNQDRIGKAVAQAMSGALDWQIVDGKRLNPQETAVAVEAIARGQKAVEDSKRQALATEQAQANPTTQSGYGNVQYNHAGTNTAQAATAQALGLPANATPAEIARESIRQKVATSVGSPTAPEARVFRELPKGEGLFRDKPLGKSSTISEFKGEYGKKIEDDAFRDWMKRRAVVLGNADPDNPALLLTAGDNLWSAAGDYVAVNPQLRATKTPEQWIDYQYELAGGDAAYEDKIKKASPITNTRQVTTYSVNAAEAQAAINDISEALLGRMASDSELKKARGAMQKLLTPTVTNTRSDATDPSNVQVTSHTKAGVGPADAQKLLEMRMKRGSEGMAMNVGQMFEQAMSRM